jgi:hypothetical protein
VNSGLLCDSGTEFSVVGKFGDRAVPGKKPAQQGMGAKARTATATTKTGKEIMQRFTRLSSQIKQLGREILLIRILSQEGATFIVPHYAFL